MAGLSWISTNMARQVELNCVPPIDAPDFVGGPYPLGGVDSSGMGGKQGGWEEGWGDNC